MTMMRQQKQIQKTLHLVRPFSTSSVWNDNNTSTPTLTLLHKDLPEIQLEKVLVANRGEIACRVVRTCKRLGIPTVSIYSVADGPYALHAQMADEAFLIGTGPHPTESYLLQDEILEICHQTKAQAIHPGYGFLSENASFCQRITSESGLVFVGPPPSAIQAMGSKSHSKAIMENANVPTTPGYYGDDTQDATFLLNQAKDNIGFPVMIKAVMGGGGKGMRLVWNESEFLEKLQACQREALGSFGDDRVLLEKYLVSPRHVEVQVVADTHGNVVHLYERDCSLQRRHQKIIEEAPASDLPLELRQRLGEMGERAAHAVGYVNAGTVEFLLDTTDPGQFYFCEMNTRLQVEHPISELITGIDLVEWQLRIADGQELPVKDQSQIPCHGHALEARIYAENPSRNFLPATGTVWHHRPPVKPNVGIDKDNNKSMVETKGVVRVDTGIQQGQEVGVYYDPMICKLIVHDETRPKALKKLVHALKQYQIAGVPTNIDFLIHCANHQTFQTAGAVNTGFLDDHLSEIQVQTEKSVSKSSKSPLAIAAGVFATLLHMEGRIGIPRGRLEMERKKRSPWSSLSGSWRMTSETSSKRVFDLVGDDDTKVECISHRDGSYDIQVRVGGQARETFHIDGSLGRNGGEMEVIVNGTKRIFMTTAFRECHGDFQVRMWPNVVGNDDDNDSMNYFWEVDIQSPMLPSSMTGASKGAGHGSVQAPMPGKIRRIQFEVGDMVHEGDILIVMEAMKMEHPIPAPASGILTEIRCNLNDVVQDGAILAIVETPEEAQASSDKSTVV